MNGLGDGAENPPQPGPSGFQRPDGRVADQLRPVRFQLDVQRHPAASCMVAFGETRVLCAVSQEDGTPRWRNRMGWITSEYAMLPGSTAPRARRETAPRGRSQEIQRLIGRSLRAVVDLAALPDVTITVDCDVVQADGGTRTAAITGGWVALAVALQRVGLDRTLTGQVAGVSVGMVGGRSLLDLAYEEDVAADVDLNVVATADGRLVEVQGTAERAPFDRAALDHLLDLAMVGCQQLFDLQRRALESATA